MTGTGRILALFAMEWRTLLRDRRTVALSIVLPLLVMPLMLFGSRWMEQRRQRALSEREFSYAVAGPRADEARALVDAARRLPPSASTSVETPLALQEQRLEDAAAALAAGTLDFYVDARNHADAAALAERARAASGTPKRTATGTGSGARAGARGSRARDRDLQALDLGDPDVTAPTDLLALSVFYRADRDESRAAATRLIERLHQVRRDQRHEALAAAGFPVAASAVAVLDTTNLARDAEVAGLALGRLITLLLLFFLLSGGAVVAQDALAGEKERGTLETLLTTAIARHEIVAAKVLLVSSVALLITVIQVANLLVYVGFGLIPASRHLTAAITPALAAGLLVFFLPLAALVSGVLVLVSGHARSYREAQLYFLPVMLIGAVPALAASLPEISLRSAVVLVPIANISVGVKEMLVGRVDWLMLPVAWLVTAIAAAGAMRLAARALSTERLIAPAATEARFLAPATALRPAHVLTWFAVMWAVVLVVTLNAGEALELRGQLVVNLIVVFVGGSLLFLRRFGLDARETLSLRMPHPAAWLAVLAGAPAALVSGIGVYRVSQVFLPAPRELLESFSQYLMPESISFWHLLPWLTLLPGICEEIAFRGVLLHTLRRFYSPLASALVVGAVFGMFHFSLFRVLPTAYLGVLLSAVTILTGSIYPAMLWHTLNNGLGLAAGRYGIAMDQLPGVTYALAAGLLAVAFWILWRTRAGVGRRRGPSGE